MNVMHISLDSTATTQYIGNAERHIHTRRLYYTKARSYKNGWHKYYNKTLLMTCSLYKINIFNCIEVFLYVFWHQRYINDSHHHRYHQVIV